MHMQPWAKRWSGAASLVAAAVLLCLTLVAHGDDGVIDRYDRHFKHYAERYFGPEVDWKYFKAQAIAESRLKKKALSHDGAMGIMQILPSTFDEIRSKNPDILDNPWKPQWNIAAAICYNRMLWDTWHAERSLQERLKFTFGSYNAGKEAILDAQQLALQDGLDATRWQAIAKTLPRVLGDAAGETIGYVADIFAIKATLPSD